MNFTEWLQTLAGGKKTRKEARKNASHCSTIFKESGIIQLKTIGQIKVLNVIDTKFITKKRKDSQASTVKNHLLSLQKLGEYMLLQEIFGKQENDKLTKQISLWNKSLGKQIRQRCAEKGAKDTC